MAVDEYQADGVQTPEGEVADGLRGEAVARNLENGSERQLCNRGDVGEPPILVLKGGKAQFGKTRQACLAQRENPRGLFRLPFKALELFQIGIGLFHDGVVNRLDHTVRGGKRLSNEVLRVKR